MRLLAALPLVFLALLLAGCAIATPLMEPVQRWERPFAVTSNVRGYVIHVQYERPEIGVRQLERSYRYERYEPLTGNWYPAELTHEGVYAFTEAAAIRIAEATGMPPPGG